MKVTMKSPSKSQEGKRPSNHGFPVKLTALGFPPDKNKQIPPEVKVAVESGSWPGSERQPGPSALLTTQMPLTSTNKPLSASALVSSTTSIGFAVQKEPKKKRTPLGKFSGLTAREEAPIAINTLVLPSSTPIDEAFQAFYLDTDAERAQFATKPPSRAGKKDVSSRSPAVVSNPVVNEIWLTNTDTDRISQKHSVAIVPEANLDDVPDTGYFGSTNLPITSKDAQREIDLARVRDENKSLRRSIQQLTKRQTQQLLEIGAILARNKELEEKLKILSRDKNFAVSRMKKAQLSAENSKWLESATAQLEQRLLDQEHKVAEAEQKHTKMSQFILDAKRHCDMLTQENDVLRKGVNITFVSKPTSPPRIAREASLSSPQLKFSSPKLDSSPPKLARHASREPSFLTLETLPESESVAVQLAVPTSGSKTLQTAAFQRKISSSASAPVLRQVVSASPRPESGSEAAQETPAEHAFKRSVDMLNLRHEIEQLQKELANQEQAATRIQSLFRGNTARKQVQEAKDREYELKREMEREEMYRQAKEAALQKALAKEKELEVEEQKEKQLALGGVHEQTMKHFEKFVAFNFKTATWTQGEIKSLTPQGSPRAISLVHHVLHKLSEITNMWQVEAVVSSDGSRANTGSIVGNSPKQNDIANKKSEMVNKQLSPKQNIDSTPRDYVLSDMVSALSEAFVGSLSELSDKPEHVEILYDSPKRDEVSSTAAADQVREPDAEDLKEMLEVSRTEVSKLKNLLKEQKLVIEGNMLDSDLLRSRLVGTTQELEHTHSRALRAEMSLERCVSAWKIERADFQAGRKQHQQLIKMATRWKYLEGLIRQFKKTAVTLGQHMVSFTGFQVEDFKGNIVVQKVLPSSPASRCGMIKGDVILRYSSHVPPITDTSNKNPNTPVPSAETFNSLLDTIPAGDVLKLIVTRGGLPDEIELSISVGGKGYPALAVRLLQDLAAVPTEEDTLTSMLEEVRKVRKDWEGSLRKTSPGPALDLSEVGSDHRPSTSKVGGNISGVDTDISEFLKKGMSKLQPGLANLIASRPETTGSLTPAEGRSDVLTRRTPGQ